MEAFNARQGGGGGGGGGGEQIRDNKVLASLAYETVPETCSAHAFGS
jgi:hypothetical protein